jgi:hypothetical protein
MYRVEDPVFAMAESSFLDGGSRLDDVDLDPLIAFGGRRSVAASDAAFPDVGRCRRRSSLACHDAQSAHPALGLPARLTATCPGSAPGSRV